MKKYTLEQLKTEKIAIHTPKPEIFHSLMDKFAVRNLNWANGSRLNGFDGFALCEDQTTVDLCSYSGMIERSSKEYYKNGGFTIITPDQIDWGEDKQADAGQDNSPAVITKAVKEWNAFKSFVKEIEAHGRGLTSNQLKTFMAKTRKDMGKGK